MKPPNILIIEDNPITRKMVRVALESEGYTAREAADGKTAVELVERQPPDLIFQDLLLPDMDGFELVNRIRALPGGGGIPIIAFSGFLSKIEQARSLQVGFTDYLFKPVEPSRLLETVRTYVRAGKQPDSPGEGRQVLLAHDDPVHLKLLKVRLEQNGFRVRTACDGVEAFEQAKCSPPDAILSDVLMPRMDGFRLCLAVRLHPQLRRVPVVLFSAAFTEEADQRLAETVGANTLLTCAPNGRDVVDALLASFGKAPRLPDRPVELTEEYTHRLIRQLERQVTLNAGLAQRLALREAEISILAVLAETLETATATQTILEELLHRSLDAAGVSKGAVYFVEPDGRLATRAQLGFTPSEQGAVDGFFGHADLLHRALDHEESMGIPSAAFPPDQSRDLLEKSAAKSIVIAPLVFGQDRMGVLVMASVHRDLGEDRVVFARAIGAEIGQSIRLARTLSLLKENEEKLERILATMADGIVISDRGGRMTYANQAAEKILGLPAEQIAGKPYNDPMWQTSTTEGKPFAEEQYPFVQVMSTGQAVYGVEQVVSRPDGSRIILSVNAAPLRDSEGIIVGVVRSLRDITRRRRAEEALLGQAQELARYNAELEQFAYVAAHHLQEPLRTVASFTQLLSIRYKGKIDSEADKFIEHAVNGAIRMRRLIDDLLAYSRLTRAKSHLEQTDCEGVFQNSLESLRASLEENAAAVTHDHLPIVVADATQLGQVFQNLLSNAVKFRGAQAPRVHVSAERQDNDWLFSVRDNGIGIDPEYSERIFQIFERLHGKDEYPGTGIGLALCKRIVEGHRGRIWVESKAGEGATFRFTVPATPA